MSPGKKLANALEKLDSSLARLRDATTEANGADKEFAFTVDDEGRLKAEEAAFCIDTAGREAAERVAAKAMKLGKR